MLQLEATKNAQLLLTKARAAGTVSDADFAAQTVKLTNQQAEQRNLLKELNQVPPAVAQLTPVAEQASQALQGAATMGLGLFSSQTDKTTGLLGKFKGGAELVRTGLTAPSATRLGWAGPPTGYASWAGW